MAKDLPYFKFFVSEWNDGDITLEDYKIQGLFINVCAYYWSRECKLDYTTLLKKFKHNVSDINSIIESDLIKLDGDKIYINFLDEQLNERLQKSKINKQNGAKGGRPKKREETKKKPNGLNSLTETKGNKRREEKRRKENIPSKELFISHALSKKPNLCQESISLKYDAWMENGWKDGNDNKIKNWKSKLTNTVPYLKVSERSPEHSLKSTPLN
jgi:hypothetical protein